MMEILAACVSIALGSWVLRFNVKLESGDAMRDLSETPARVAVAAN
jgi:hypothetical protein